MYINDILSQGTPSCIHDLSVLRIHKSPRATHLARSLIDDEHERPFAAQRVRDLAVLLRVRVRRRHRQHRLGPARVFGEAGVVLL